MVGMHGEKWEVQRGATYPGAAVEEEPTRDGRHQHHPFCEHFPPLKCAFWSQPRHFFALAEGLSPEEAAALEYEYSLVVAGERDVLGRPCLCDVMGDSRVHAVGGFRGYGDSTADLVGLKVDLERAADILPLRWKATRRIYVTQLRGEVYRQRFGQMNAGKLLRPQDADPEPRDERGRYLGYMAAYRRMAKALGWVPHEQRHVAAITGCAACVRRRASGD